MTNDQRLISKQQRQILIISIVGVLFIIWGAASYFSEHPSLVTTITPQEMFGEPKADIPSGMDKNTHSLMALMQKLQNNPNDLQTLLGLSKYFIQMADWKQAENFTLRAIAINPNDPELLYLLGIAQYNQGKHTDAAESLEMVLEKEADPSAQYSLGLLYLHYLNKKQKGIQYLKTVLKNPKLTPEIKEAVEKELDEIKNTKK